MLCFFDPGVGQINIDGRVAGGLHKFQKILPFELEGGGGDARMAADEFAGHQVPVDDQLDTAFRIEQQLQGGDGAGSGLEAVPHMVLAGEGQPGAAQLGGEEFGLEGLVPWRHQQVEVRLLLVAQEQVFTDLGAQHLLHLVADLNGVGVVVLHPDVGDIQLLQPVVDGQLLGDAAVCGTAGVSGLIDIHGITPYLSR